MTPRDRVFAALNHKPTDQVPRFEIWIDGLLDELGFADPAAAGAGLGQDCVMLPSQALPGSSAWGTGVDEWGRIWRDGSYAGGTLATEADLDRYTPPVGLAAQRFDPRQAQRVRRTYPDHCLIFGTHIGPLHRGLPGDGVRAILPAPCRRRRLRAPATLGAHRLVHCRLSLCEPARRRGRDLARSWCWATTQAAHRAR